MKINYGMYKKSNIKLNVNNYIEKNVYSYKIQNFWKYYDNKLV